MKPDSLTKFSLTIIAALVLAACGSSGSGDKVVAPTTGATATTPSTTVTQPAANQADAAAKKAQAEAEAAKAAAEKAKAEAEKARADADAAKAKAEAEKAKAGNESDAAKQAQAEAEAAKAEADAAKAEAEAAKAEADAAKAEAAAVKQKLEAEEAARKQAEADAAKAKAEAAEKAKAEAEKAEAERAKAEANAKAKENQDRTADNANLRSTPTGSDLLQKSSVGAKVVSKQDSNAGTTVSQVQDSTASRPELLNVQEPDALFRSFVVGEATGKDGKKYALMLDQLGNLKDNPNDGGYVALAKSNSNPLLTDRQGQTKKTDKAYVKTVENQRLNYTSNYNGSLAAAYFVDTSGRDPALVVKGGTGNPARTDKTRLLEAKDKDGFLVGELYGVHANDGKSVANFIYTTGETERNAPFVRNKYQNVQYGSLTSALHNLNADEFSGYIPNTKVVPYGIKGAAYTEDNYFYRLNENNMDAESYKTFKQKHPNSVLKYEGHAVTYGLDNNWNGPVNKGDNKVVGPVVNNIPTSPLVPSTPKTPAADNFKPELFSGTHVAAQINLGDVNKVTGSIYNKWTDNTTATGYKNVRLVDFEGTMSDIGNIAGTAINNTSESSKTGLFGATLNADASEMGGIVASDKHEPAEKWGAVFGAQLTDVSAAAVFKPADATKPAVQTNGNTTIVKP